jgi:hypothetical protein
MSWKGCVGVCALLAAPAFVGCASTSVDAIEPPTMEQSMERMTAFGMPGDAHKALEPRVGRWNLTVRMYDERSPEPMAMTGTSDVRWIFDGRYLEDRTRGEFMGQVFEGLGYTAYDNLKQKYVGSWCDSMSTGIMTAEGSYDPATKTFTYTGVGPDVDRGRYVPTRSIERWIDNDHVVMEMYGPGYDGKERKMMEIEYVRAR